MATVEVRARVGATVDGDGDILAYWLTSVDVFVLAGGEMTHRRTWTGRKPWQPTGPLTRGEVERLLR